MDWHSFRALGSCSSTHLVWQESAVNQPGTDSIILCALIDCQFREMTAAIASDPARTQNISYNWMLVPRWHLLWDSFLRWPFQSTRHDLFPRLPVPIILMTHFLHKVSSGVHICAMHFERGCQTARSCSFVAAQGPKQNLERQAK